MTIYESRNPVLLIGALCIAAAGCGGAHAEQLENLGKTLEGEIAAQKDTRANFYQSRDFLPHWVHPERLSEAGRQLVEELCSAEELGLDARRYDVADILAAYKKAYTDGSLEQRSSALVALELQLTDSLARFVQHAREGQPRVSERQPWHYEEGETPQADEVALLERIASDGIARTLDRLSNETPKFAATIQALDRYIALRDAGGWSRVDAETDLSHGAEGQSVRALAARLTATGDLSAETDVYDDGVKAAVERFQKRHGVEVTGVVDADTRAALNVSAADRVTALQLNLERMRWLPPAHPKRQILVNIPEYLLHAYLDGEKALEMRVVVGTEHTRTPIFADEIERVVLRPYWNVPASIAVGELLPNIRKDPTYLSRKNYEIVDGAGNMAKVADLTPEKLESYDLRIRQTPGPHNALGLIKFLFPNEFAVYLHDTPADQLFSRTERSFSHGCVRVEEPVTLAEYVLKAGGVPMPKEKIAKRIQDKSVVAENFELKKTIPVTMAYLTAWVDNDGEVNFRDDVYGYDSPLEPMFERASDEPRACETLRDLIQGDG